MNRFAVLVSWTQEHITAAITAAGLCLYVFLRLPYSIYYGRLGTSPEEIGLGYIDILSQSTVGVTVIVLATVSLILVACFVFGYVTIFAISVPESQRLRQQRRKSSNRDTSKMTDEEYEEFVHVARAGWKKLTPYMGSKWPGASDYEAMHREVRHLRRQSARTEAEESRLKTLRDRLDLGVGDVGSVLAIATIGWMRRIGPKVFLATTLLVLVFVVPALAVDQARAVKNGGGASVSWLGLFGLRGDRATVQWVDKDTSDETRKFVTGEILLLGRTDNVTVLFDSSEGRAVRIPSEKVVVKTSEP